MAKTPPPPKPAAGLPELNLREMREFRDLTGMEYLAGVRQLMPRACSAHRMEFQLCGDCKAATAPVCPDHLAVWGRCDDCPPVNIEVMYAVYYLIRRREDADLTWEAVSELGPSEVTAGMGFLDVVAD